MSKYTLLTKIEKKRRKNTQNRDFSKVRSQHEDAMKTTRRRANNDRYVFLYAKNDKNIVFVSKHAATVPNQAITTVFLSRARRGSKK